jgi:predicted HNH restriction endonuclease
MRNSLTNAIVKYIGACKNSTWVSDEAYKFEFANYIFHNIKWDFQSNEQILHILEESQKLKYTGNAIGIQFVMKSGRVKLSEFISIEDVKLLRRVHNGEHPKDMSWKDRSMSFTGLSAWLASLFPKLIYPVPLTGFNKTVKYLFDTDNKSFPKKGKKYLFHCQSFMQETEKLLKQYPIEELCLRVWNQYYKANPDLSIVPKGELTKIDWVWLVQDFHLYVHREILGLYNKKEKDISVADEFEPTAIEGNSKLATHMRYERNSAITKKIKEKAIKENEMLNCEVCGFSFLEIYGEVGEGFIEAHHIDPLSESKGQRVTKKEDIALICSNCHRMLHRTENGKLLSINELKARLKK